MAVTFVPLYFGVDASGFAYPTPGTTADTMQLGRLDLTGVAGVALDANNCILQNLADPSGAQDAATLTWVNAQITAALTGLSWKGAVLAATTGALPSFVYTNGTLGVGAKITASVNGPWSTTDSDGVTLVAGTVLTGSRFLVKDETTTNAPYNGIYVCTNLGGASAKWEFTRAQDNDVIAEMNEATVAVDQGTVNVDSTWVQTAQPATMGTNDITWVAGPSITPYTAGAGLSLALGVFSVKAGDGIETASNTASTNVRLDGTAPGIVFTGAAGSGALKVKADAANATTTVTSNGVNVDWAPDYRTLRVAAGGGIAAAGVGCYYSGSGVISAGDSSNIAKCGIIGVSRAAISGAGTGQLGQNGDIISTILTGASPGTPYYMGHSGTPILASALSAGDRAIQLGFARTSTDLEVRIQDLGKKP
jgi:hypothetical protein